MTTIACVLKSGGAYQLEHFVELYHGVMRHAPTVRRVVLLTDQPTGLATLKDMEALEIKSLVYHWPGWWSKMELFRPELWGQNEPVVYLDLDTVVSLLVREEFTMLKDFYRPEKAASGVMAWYGKNTPSWVLEEFRLDASRHMAHYRRWPHLWGDQGFIVDHLNSQPQRFQHGLVASYKRDCKEREVVPEGAVAIAFHGRPRPWEVDLSWLQTAV